jgi:uncharacterized protein (TIRG00374 family)
VASDSARDVLIRRGNQNEFPALLVESLKIFEERLIIRKRRRVERNPLSHLALQTCPATQQPEGKQEENKGIGPHHRQDGFMKGIGPDQSSVQVDTERRLKLLVERYGVHQEPRRGCRAAFPHHNSGLMEGWDPCYTADKRPIGEPLDKPEGRLPRDQTLKAVLRSWLPATAKVVIAASLIAWLIHRGALNLGAITGALAHWPLLLVVAVLFCGQTLTLAYRWQLLLRAQNVGLLFRDIFSLTMIGLLFNVVSPGAVGGDLIKSYYVHRRVTEHRAEAVATIVLDRITGMITLFIVASVAALPTLLFSTDRRLRGLAFAAVAAAVVALGGMAVAIRMSSAAAASDHPNAAIRFMLRAFGSLLIYKNRPGAFIRPMLVSIFGWLLSCAAFYAAALAAGAPAFSVGLIFLVPLGLMTTTLPVSPGGIGVGQVAFAELFRIGSNGEYSFGANAYTVLQAVQILGSLSVFFFYLGWRRELRETSLPEAATALNDVA